jgi:hypothetical protein
MHRNAVSSCLYSRRTDTEAGRAELPAYCRGIMNPALRPLLLRTRVPQLGRRMQFLQTTKKRLRKDTGRRHLLAEVVLVLADRAVPPADSLVLTDHDVLSNLVEETNRVSKYLSEDSWDNIPEVVGNDNDTTTESVDGICQRVDGRDIETVGRLVEQQHVGTLNSKKGENNTGLLTVGEGGHLRCHQSYRSVQAAGASTGSPG